MNRIPPELYCEIFKDITNIREVFRLLQVSSDFRASAGLCIRNLTSPIVEEIPLSLLTPLYSLREISPRIMIYPENLEIPGTLRLGHFSVEDSSRLVIHEEFLYSFKNTTIQFKDGQARLYGEDIPLNFHTIQAYTPYRILNRNAREFLVNADFGLVDIFQPPSPDNPPVSLLAQKIGLFGIATFQLMYDLMRICSYAATTDGARAVRELRSDIISTCVVKVRFFVTNYLL